MISAQTPCVCREGKPAPTSPDHALGPGPLAIDWALRKPAWQAIILVRQVSQHGFARFFGSSERFERRADDLDGGSVLKDRPPRGYEAREAV